MAFQTLHAANYPPFHFLNTTNNLLLDASGEKAAFIFFYPKAGNVSKIHFRLALVTSGQTLKASLQNVDLATGFPDGTVDQSGTVAVANNDDNSWKEVTLGSSRTVTAGELGSVVIEFNATAGNLNIPVFGQPVVGNVYAAHFTASWAKQVRTPIFGLEYDDGSFAMVYGTYPAIGNTIAYNNGTATTEVGLYFQYPFPVKIHGVHMGLTLAGDCDIVLYDTNGTTVLGTVSLDKDVYNGTTTEIYAMFSSPITLVKNTTYRLVAKPTSATSVTFYTLDAPTAAALGQMPAGTNFHLTEKTSGSWAQTNTRRPIVSPMIEAFDDAVSVGGGVFGPKRKTVQINNISYNRTRRSFSTLNGQLPPEGNTFPVHIVRRRAVVYEQRQYVRPIRASIQTTVTNQYPVFVRKTKQQHTVYVQVNRRLTGISTNVINNSYPVHVCRPRRQFVNYTQMRKRVQPISTNVINNIYPIYTRRLQRPIIVQNGPRVRRFSIAVTVVGAPSLVIVQRRRKVM